MKITSNNLDFEEGNGIIFSGSLAGLAASFEDILRFSDSGKLYDHIDLEYAFLDGNMIFSDYY